MWTVEEFSTLVSDAHRLLMADLRPRATGLLNRWLHGMSISDLVKTIAGIVVRERLQTGVDDLFAKLGRLARELAWALSPGVPTNTT